MDACFGVHQLGRCLLGKLSGMFWKRKEEAEREWRESGKSLRGKEKQTCFSGFWTRIVRRRGDFDSIMLWEISGGGWELFLLLWRRGENFPTSLASTIPALLYRVMSPYKRDFLGSRCLKNVLAGLLKEGEFGKHWGIEFYGRVECGELVFRIFLRKRECKK